MPKRAAHLFGMERQRASSLTLLDVCWLSDKG